MKVWASLAAATLVVVAPLAAARVHDTVFAAGGFETITDRPANAAEAARFLTQATFGPTSADISKVMAVGYGEWIEEQLGLPTTLSEPNVETVANKRAQAQQQAPGQSTRINRWLWQATYAPDQLRQRMAFALSQIFVVSDQTSAISADVVPMAAYQDLLAKDAFNIYVNTLQDVTLNPTMGKFLSSFHNQRGNCTAPPNVTCTTNPDENYAREVMQLFSIGLVELNLDGTLPGGVEIPCLCWQAT